MNKYAELILKKGIQIQVNEPLLIVSSVEKIEFVRILTQTAYNMGIKKIDYLLEDDILKYKAYKSMNNMQKTQERRAWIEACAIHVNVEYGKF